MFGQIVAYWVFASAFAVIFMACASEVSGNSTNADRDE
jgi:hypothetical protein